MIYEVFVIQEKFRPTQLLKDKGHILWDCANCKFLSRENIKQILPNVNLISQIRVHKDES